jgi:hypothetical protein
VIAAILFAAEIFTNNSKVVTVLKQSIMFEKAKLIAIGTASVIVLTAFATGAIGRKYDASKDFTCCKGDQLYMHHFYKTRICWIEITNGYNAEPIGKPTPGGCNVQCAAQ